MKLGVLLGAEMITLCQSAIYHGEDLPGTGPSLSGLFSGVDAKDSLNNN